MKGIEARMNAVLAVPLEVIVDEIIHSEDNPFCDDRTCPCYLILYEMSAVRDFHREGLLSDEEYKAARAAL